MDASFVYNENGLRVQKTVNGVVTNYTLHGKNVVHIYMVEREIQSADFLSCGFATFVPKTFGAGFFTPRPDTIVPQSRQTTCSLSSRLTLLSSSEKGGKVQKSSHNSLILLPSRNFRPFRKTSDNHPGKPRNSISKGLSHPLQPPKKKAAATNLSQRPKEGVCIEMQKT